jgi:hypothetical protein
LPWLLIRYMAMGWICGKATPDASVCEMVIFTSVTRCVTISYCGFRSSVQDRLCLPSQHIR